MSFNVLEYIDRKKAGMALVCRLIAEDHERQAKTNAEWTDRTAHARQGLEGDSRSLGNNEHMIFLRHGVDYGEILEDGSKPHIITPKNGKFLYWKGAAHPVKKVNHPGTKGFKTLRKTFEENKDKTIERITEYWGG